MKNPSHATSQFHPKRSPCRAVKLSLHACADSKAIAEIRGKRPPVTRRVPTLFFWVSRGFVRLSTNFSHLSSNFLPQACKLLRAASIFLLRACNFLHMAAKYLLNSGQLPSGVCQISLSPYLSFFGGERGLVAGWYGSFPILGRSRKPSHGARFCLSVLIVPVATARECYQGEAGVFKISFS